MPAELFFSGSDIKIIELLGSGDLPRIEAMLKLYKRFFPIYAHYIPRMRQRANLPSETRSGHKAHYWLIEYKNTPVGLTTFRYILSRKCGLGIAFALDPDVRSVHVNGKRLSAFVIDKILEQLLADSVAMGNSGFLGFITEVEHTELMDHYKKMGMLELPIQYFEPVFPPEANGQQGKETVNKISFIPVILGITPNPEAVFKSFAPSILEDFALAFLVDHYGLDEEHHKVQEVINSIYKNAEVLDDYNRRN